MKLAFAGGGTGGHLAPAVGIIEELRFRGDDTLVLFLTAGRSAPGMGETFLETRAVSIRVSSISSRRWWTMPRALLNNYRGYRQSLPELRRTRPDLVVGLGGYVSVPSVLAARRLKIPVVLNEQNMVLGRANRVLSRFAELVLGSFPCFSARAGDKFRGGVGFPIRQAVREAAPPETLKEWGLKTGEFTILILGGSRGARTVNLLIKKLLPLLGEEGEGWHFIHCAGRDDVRMMERAYREAGITATVLPGLEKIGWGYSQADLVVGRAGGATLSEIAYWGLPSVLIPYPWATDDHQLKNARYFSSSGAALVYEQMAGEEDSMAESIRALKEDKDSRERMAAAARSLYVPGAAGKMLDLFQEVIEMRK